MPLSSMSPPSSWYDWNSWKGRKTTTHPSVPHPLPNPQMFFDLRHLKLTFLFYMTVSFLYTRPHILRSWSFVRRSLWYCRYTVCLGLLLLPLISSETVGSAWYQTRKTKYQVINDPCSLISIFVVRYLDSMIPILAIYPKSQDSSLSL